MDDQTKGEFMKSLILSLAALLTLSTGFAAANAGQETKEMMVGISDAYVPGGFDSDSDAFVVVNGIFPNGCYRWSRADVTHEAANLHEIRNYAKVQSGMCIMVLVPFTKEVHLGKLTAGTHKLRFLNGDGTYLEKQLTVE